MRKVHVFFITPRMFEFELADCMHFKAVWFYEIALMGFIINSVALHAVCFLCIYFESIWAATWQNQQNGMCAQRRLRSAWASAYAQPDLSLRWAHSHFVGLVMGWLKLWLRKILKKMPKNWVLNEPPHDKTNRMTVPSAKTQISLGIRPVWSESSLCVQWVAKDPRFLQADSEDSDQTERMPRLIWVFAGPTGHSSLPDAWLLL